MCSANLEGAGASPAVVVSPSRGALLGMSLGHVPFRECRIGELRPDSPRPFARGPWLLRGAPTYARAPDGGEEGGLAPSKPHGLDTVQAIARRRKCRQMDSGGL